MANPRNLVDIAPLVSASNTGNLGIGTTAPTAKLHIEGATLQALFEGSTQGNIVIKKTGSIGYSIYQDATSKLAFYDNDRGVTDLTLLSGNLGLGVTPSAWDSVSVWKSLQVRGAALSSTSTYSVLSYNGYENLGWKYIASGAATAYTQNAGSHSWLTAPSGTADNAITFTQALTLNTNGALVLQGGDTAASGVGITFPATQNASSNANTLDDYEEGTFTPGVDYDGTGSLSVTYSTRAGSYTKVGNLVTISIQIRLTSFSKGSASGEMGIWGLPFTVGTASGDETFVGSLAYYDTPFNSVPICFVASNTSVIRFRSISNNAAWAFQPDPDGNSQWFITLTYRTAT